MSAVRTIALAAGGAAAVYLLLRRSTAAAGDPCAGLTGNAKLACIGATLLAPFGSFLKRLVVGGCDDGQFEFQACEYNGRRWLAEKGAPTAPAKRCHVVCCTASAKGVQPVPQVRCRTLDDRGVEPDSPDCPCNWPWAPGGLNGALPETFRNDGSEHVVFSYPEFP